MGTKNDPGKFDCYAKLAPNEPYFVLRAQDRTASYVVEAWVKAAAANGCPPAKLDSARRVATAMRKYQPMKSPD